MTPTEHVTYCRICEPLCGMVATVDEGRVTKLRPDKEHPLSRGFACPKGIAMTEVQNDPERVLHPQRRRADGTLRADRLEDRARRDRRATRGRSGAEHGGESIGWYMGNPGAFSYSHPLWVKGFVDALGSQHYYTASSQDVSNRFAASSLLYGSPYVLPIPDLSRTELLLIVGANPLVSHGSVMSAPRIKDQLNAIVGRGGRVVVIDPRRSETAREFEHVPLRPDSDAQLLLSMLNVVFAESLEDAAALGRAAGADDLRELVAPYDPESTAGGHRRRSGDRARARPGDRRRPKPGWRGDLRADRLLPRPQRHARLVPARRAGARDRQPRQRRRLDVRRRRDPVRPGRRGDRRRRLRQAPLPGRRVPRGARRDAGVPDGEGDHDARPGPDEGAVRLGRQPGAQRSQRRGARGGDRRARPLRLDRHLHGGDGRSSPTTCFRRRPSSSARTCRCPSCRCSRSRSST